MCIKFINGNVNKNYDPSKPLEDQIDGFQDIMVDYDPQDSSIELFLKEIQRIIKTGLKANFNIKVQHNNNIFGFKVKKKLQKANTDLVINDIIKMMVLGYSNTDKKLEELSTTCNGLIK